MNATPHSAARPRLLDLFCGAGGAAMGLEAELAWAAGFFDGEGCVSVRNDRRPGRTPRLQLDIEQTDERPLVRFQAAVGRGRMTLRPSRAPSRKALYRLNMAHQDTIDTMAAVWPYLSEPKREQFIAALRTVEQIP